MFPTFISILDIQSWWEVPSIAHFCSLFRTAFNLLDFDIEDLEEALLTDGTEESSWLQDLIVRLLSGCLPNNEISTFNYQMFLRRLFRQKCQEHDLYNPFNTDIDFQLLPLRTKVDILHALCDFRLDADDVLEQLKNLEADSLRVEPLGYDSNDSAYWYFYGTRLYREDYTTKNNKKKAVWQVICFTEDDWFQLTKKFKKSTNKAERQLHLTLSENFLPELPRLFKEKENLARKRLLENLPRRTSSRLKKLESESEREVEKLDLLKEEKHNKELIQQQEEQKKKDLEIRRQEAYDRRAKLKEKKDSGNLVKSEEENIEKTDDKMASTRNKKTKNKEKNTKDEKEAKNCKTNKKREKSGETESKLFTTKPPTVGRQTNNSLSAATGQILIEPVKNSNKKKLKTSQIFRQTDEDLQTGMHKILDHVKNHEDAWPFTEPVEEEYAPNYYTIIRKPMDLQRMEERLESGYYKSFDKFRADFQLIVDNCKLYNGAENEYTEMVDNLLKVFQKATDKYLDQISSSDDEIAIEFYNEAKNKAKNKKVDSFKTESSHHSLRKPMLVAQTDKKRERSKSIESDSSLRSKSYDSSTEVSSKSSKHRKHGHNNKTPETSNKINKSTKKEDLKTSKKTEKKDRVENKEKFEPKKEKSSLKKALKSKSKKSYKKEKIKEKKKKLKDKIESRSQSLSPPPSDSPPPSSPESRFDVFPKKNTNKKQKEDLFEMERSNKQSKRNSEVNDIFEDFEDIEKYNKKQKKDDGISLSPKPKDKHNKLRETIEKLKAKSEIKLKNEFDFEIDDPKENKEKLEKQDKEEKNKINKDKPHKSYKSNVDLEVESNNTMDSIESDAIKIKKTSISSTNIFSRPTSNMDALSIATEQTLKDINKWLDDTPKFTDFSSASNSPSYVGGLDELDSITNKLDQSQGKKVEKQSTTKKEMSNKDHKKKPFRDPSKFFKKREVQRTIDRLQPGKSKGNLISSVQNTNKADEIFPLGPLAKLKDTKNSLIVKTNSNAPKLSLGSVLDSFGKHKFVDDQKVEQENQDIQEPNEKLKIEEVKEYTEKSTLNNVENNTDKTPQDNPVVEDPNNGGATPNLSAWFKAFGAPKIQPVTKKSETKIDAKDEKTEEQKPECRKIAMPVASPNPDSPHGQPTSRQRRISTGSSVSERSSFSQDMDSPRVGMDERGAYPAPYPSPLHRSPSGASPIMASPRPDISPKATYSTINGQIRVGFYQDTVSNKSSPDKSCSPKENSQSPYPHYSEHVYTPNTTENTYYSYNNNTPYYKHVPNYSSTNPTPPYNTDGNYSYYDNKTQTTHSYSTNSPVANLPSPISHHPSSASPKVHSDPSPIQHSSSIHSQHSPSMHSQQSPSMHSQHSPSMHSQHSPSMHSQHSPSMHSQHSPSIHSQHSPSVYSPHSPTVLSPNINSQHSPGIQNQQQSPIIQRPSSVACANTSEIEICQPQEEQTKSDKANQSLGSVYPVKKRTYNESELTQITNQRFEIDSRLTQQIELKKNIESQLIPKDKIEPKPYVHQNIPDPKNLNIQSQEDIFNRPNLPQATTNFSYNSEGNYQLNIPGRGEPSLQDMSKYTNMGYTGPDLNTRSLSQHITSISSTMSQKQITSTQPTLNNPKMSSEISHMRYGNPNLALQQMGYKGVETTISQQSHGNFGTSAVNSTRTDVINDRLPHIQKTSNTNIPRSTYNSSSSDVARSMTNLSHIVDRYSNDERMMVGLQNASSFYNDKTLGSAHILNKNISNQNSTVLPIFTQSNMAAIQSYNQNITANSSLYNRQISDLQNQGMIQNDLKNSQLQMQEKKTKKRKSSKNATSSSEMQQQASNQGFQSYSGIKGSSSLEPSAISLKTSSVVPGSAFNFGPTPTGLSIGSSLYSDKEGYSNFLEEFRSAPNYYMAAAAAHHRSTPDNSEKQSRPAHQNTNTQSYPFLSAPQARSTYPIAGPFIPNAQAQLMDTSSPLYQHYLQAGVLNQGLLPPGAYPPGYHPALSIRQPYDSMNRPPWL